MKTKSFENINSNFEERIGNIPFIIDNKILNKNLLYFTGNSG
jgi:hypothetical protein